MNSPKGGDALTRRPQVGRVEPDNRQLSVSSSKGPANAAVLPNKNNGLKNGTQKNKKEDKKMEFELPRIRKFANPPSSQPLTLCMEIENPLMIPRGLHSAVNASPLLGKDIKVVVTEDQDEKTDLAFAHHTEADGRQISILSAVTCTEPEKDCHSIDVLKAIEAIVPKALEMKILLNIQFENINVICGTAQLKNRWLITVADIKTRDKLLRSGLLIKEENIALRRRDDIVMEDYSLYLKRQLAPKTMDILNNKAKI